MPPKKKRFTDSVIAIDNTPPTLEEKIAPKKLGVAPSRQGKVALTAHIAPELKREVKKCALDNDVSLEAFVVEGLQLALTKYKK